MWLTSGLLVLTGAVLLLEPFSGGSPPPEDTGGPPEPDLTLEEAEITQYRESGELKYRLAAPWIEHFEGEPRTELSQPELSLFSPPDPPWEVASELGSIRNRPRDDGTTEEEVFLDQDVVMEQHFTDGRQFRLNTPSIYVYPDRQYAETSRDVTIDTHAGRTMAVGLKGNLQTGQLQLFSDADQRVHTIVLPHQFK